MKARIQIPTVLYQQMISYIRDHYDPQDHARFSEIQSRIAEKEAALLRHNLYSGYKTQQDAETRESLRTAYLDEAGIPSHGRWDEETERSFREELFTDYPD